MGVCVKLKMLVSAICVVILLAMTGCKKEMYTPDEPVVDPENVFDFSTREKYTLHVKYDVPENYKVYFEVYTKDPELLDADGQVVKRDIEPVDVGFTDGNGEYNHKIEVPATAKYLYIYSPYAGVPRVLVAEIKDGVLSEAAYPDEIEGARSMLGRAGDGDYKNEAYNTITGKKLSRLGYWKNAKGAYSLKGVTYDLYGRPDYTKVGDRITVSRDILNLINQTVPEGGKVDPSLIRNGDIRVTKKAHIDLFLIDETTSANNTLAYYCYETNNPPKKEADIKVNDIVIAFPNAKVLKRHDYEPRGNNGALERGEGVRLHYYKDGKDMGEEFPEGVSIGWIIYNQAYRTAVNGNALNTGVKHYFADKDLNGNGKGNVVLFRSGEKVMFGFEDWNGDYDYNDVVFYVKADPIEAITPDIPDVKPTDPDDSNIVAEVTYRGILTFEDLWPYRGDFDMNDVVVEYESTVGYNQANEVLRTIDNYTILWSGASYDNSFAYQLEALRGEVEVEISSSLAGNGGAFVDPEVDRATIRLANNVRAYANEDEKVAFKVVTKYTGRKINKEDFVLPPYNPFITTSSLDKEVHLTNMRPTEKLNKDNLGYGNDKSDPSSNLYYVTYDENGQQMPFAINIVYENKEDLNNFVIPKEKRHIDTYYPKFLNWVKTKGKEDADWYLHPSDK